MKLKIHQVGEPVLRERARILSRDEIASQEIQELIVHMRDSMRDAPGVGLAAPQIGMSLQLAVIEDQASYIEKMPAAQVKERLRAPVPFHVIINPRLTVTRGDMAAFPEGCLSLAGFSAVVPRALAVRVEALNEKGDLVTIEAEGWYARILQHEIDHLHGGLYIDRMRPRTFTSVDNFSRYWKDMTTAEMESKLG